MVHLSEDSHKLIVTTTRIQSQHDLAEAVKSLNGVCFLRLPVPTEKEKTALAEVDEIVSSVGDLLAQNATLIIYGDVIDLVHIHTAISSKLRYQLWIALKRKSLVTPPFDSALAHHHVGALVYTKYDKQLQHTKTRIEYTYCPACNKTTKDYGGKKHTYHHYGTLLSDIWRDIEVDPNGDISLVTARFADLFGLEHYTELRVCDLTSFLGKRVHSPKPKVQEMRNDLPVMALESNLLQGDCLTQLATLPDNSIDFVFADPPYNLKKEYRGYSDDLDIEEYFSWCDKWISEIARVLRPGGTFALLNIPLWSIRHFLHLETVLEFQNWIVWDALSFPVRMIMPAHYTILCFTKGNPRPLPGLTGYAGQVDIANGLTAFQALTPLEEGFCLRSQCISRRTRLGINDRGILSDIWWDIHRLKHNTRRVDHPCQLPPQLMYRLIALFTQPGEIVLDCFNGAGTSTLAAHQIGRRYIGIELEEQYHQMALERHHEIERGLDPFRKEERELTVKNSPVARLKKQKYEVPKKTLQLEVKRVARLLGKLPNRDEMVVYGKYPIRYYDEYFTSWGEVCAAARTTGMRETRDDDNLRSSQPRLF